MDAGSILSSIAGGGVGGAVLLAIVGAIKGAMEASPAKTADGRGKKDDAPQHVPARSSTPCGDSKGRFKDIQTYKRAHGQDVRRKAKKREVIAAPRGRAYNAAAMSFIRPLSRGLTVGA